MTWPEVSEDRWVGGIPLGPVGTLGSSTSSRINGKLGEGFRMEAGWLDLS